MRQIPTSGKFCGDCYVEWRGLSWWCMTYNKKLGFQYIVSIEEVLRLPECLADRPQVLTEKERDALEARGISTGVRREQNRKLGYEW